jgi:amidase
MLAVRVSNRISKKGYAGNGRFAFWISNNIDKRNSKKEVSSVEIVNAYLTRIETVNPKLNAVVQLTAGTALKQAKEADEALARGEFKGPLNGVPMTIKDSLDTSNIITTWGTPGRAGYKPNQDATVVARLRRAGAILLGKTNTPEFTLSFETDNPIYGRTNNPYDVERTSGGSSGGAAAIVSAGGAPFDIGSDTAGSIRLPSHFCGVAGIKPTSGCVPRTGHAIPPGGLIDALTHIGPIAPYVEDLMVLLPIIAGPDNQDPFIVPVSLGNPKMVKLEGLHGTFHIDNGIQTPIPEISQAVQASVEMLTKAGVRFEEARPPGIEQTANLMTDLLGWDGGAWRRLLLERAGTSVNQTSMYVADPDTAVKGEKVVAIVDRWDQFRISMLDFISSYDVMITPVNAYQAIPHGTWREKIKGISYAMSHNLTGWPSVVVRVGTADDGLPIGVQIITKPWKEDIALAVAQHLETVFGGWQPPLLETQYLHLPKNDA